MTAQGQPIEGQLNYFGKLADQKDECNILPSRSIYSRKTRLMCIDAINRFKKETLRIFGVLDIHLSGKYTGEAREYLAGKGKGTYSVADIGSWRKYSCALEI
jgi:glutathione S-transferase